MKKLMQPFVTVFVLVLFIVCLAPFGVVLEKSLYLPETGLSFQAYYDVFLGTPRYLLRFWRSLDLCLYIMAGQVLVSVLAGYGFAKCNFPGRNVIFFCLMILMVLPLQVTLVPNYVILNKLHMLGEDSALIFPAIFVPLGTFLMTQSFKAVPDEVVDAAMLDGCGIPRTLIRVAVPMSKGSVVCVGLLSFLDAWNMVEQPVAYLRNFDTYPISVALAYVSASDSVHQFVCCLLVLLPPLFLFSCFHKEMVDGIVLGEEK